MRNPMTLVTSARRNDRFRAFRSRRRARRSSDSWPRCRRASRPSARCRARLESFEPNPPGVPRPMCAEQRIQQQPRALPERRQRPVPAPHAGVVRLLGPRPHEPGRTRPRSTTTTSAIRSADPTASRSTATGRATSRRSPCLRTGSAARSRMTGPAAPPDTVVGSRRTAATASPCGATSSPTGRTARSSSTSAAGTSRTTSTATVATVADVTTLPTTFAPGQQHGRPRPPTWPEGSLAIPGRELHPLPVGRHRLQVIDASNPGPVGSITANYPRTTITSADFGGRTIAALLRGRRSRRRDEGSGSSWS